jgi:hypothetical protein
MRWPVASLGPLRRARVLAMSVPGAAWAEDVLDAPFDAVWTWLTDLEVSVPRFDSQVDALRVRDRWTEGDAQRLRITASSMGVRIPFDVRLEEGFCIMKAAARLYVVVMAAEPEDGGRSTRYFHLEGVPLPGARMLRRYIQRGVDADLRNLARLARQGF